MGRRWVVQVDTITDYANQRCKRYLGRSGFKACFMPWREVPMEAVTPPHAKLFVTKREALTAAEEAGFDLDTVEAIRKPW